MNRDISLDILRGLMLIIMASDHFGEPVFQHLYEFSGYVSAAEGFVFLSGMLVALVYSRYYAAGGLVLEKRVWQRAGTIYFYHFFIDFDKNNSFLQFYQFNNLCIQDFLLQLMNKSCILKNVEIMETDIPF